MPTTRRDALQAALTAAAVILASRPAWASVSTAEKATSAPSSDLPTEVAGIELPRSAIALKAAQFARAHCPDYLFNHCMRTYLFGAIALRSEQRTYDVDKAFAAAALHDLGLLREFASTTGSFEIDGANQAERLMLESGLSAQDAAVVWHAIVLHDVRFALTRRQGPEAMLVAIGAGSDVYGPDPGAIEPHRLADVVAAFPRLHFKQRFTALAVDHCRRKPLSQKATWLEGLCREQVPSAWTDTVEHGIATAAFDE